MESKQKQNTTNLIGSVSFKCPNCRDSKITRTAHNRIIVAKYICTNCNFVGP